MSENNNFTEKKPASEFAEGDFAPLTEEEQQTYYRVLELDYGALMPEIKSAYYHLRKLYSSDSMVLSPIMEDMSEEKRRALLSMLDEAYNRLKRHLSQHERRQISSAHERVARHNVPEFDVFSGNALKLTREVLGIELKEIALYSGIPVKHLQNIEMERIHLLPPKGYIRVFLKKYAEFLSLNPDRVINDYMKLVEKKSKM